MTVGWRYGLQFMTIPTASLASPSVAPVISVETGGTMGGNWIYAWRACYDATGKNHTALSGNTQRSATGVYRLRVSWEANPAIEGARWYQCFKRVLIGGNYYYRLVYSGPERWFYDYGNSITTYAQQEDSPTVDTSGTTYRYDLSPTGSFPHPKDPTKPGYFDLVTACEVSYLDQAEDDDGDLQSINRNLLRKEFGVRPVLALSFMVDGGSDEEEALTAIYCSKLAYPDKVSKGVKVWVTLNGRSHAPIWRECTIKGDLPRTPDSGVNVRLVFSWDVRCAQLIPSVPPINAFDGSTLW